MLKLPEHDPVPPHARITSDAPLRNKSFLARGDLRLLLPHDGSASRMTVFVHTPSHECRPGMAYIFAATTEYDCAAEGDLLFPGHAHILGVDLIVHAQARGFVLPTRLSEQVFGNRNPDALASASMSEIRTRDDARLHVIERLQREMNDLIAE